MSALPFVDQGETARVLRYELRYCPFTSIAAMRTSRISQDAAKAAQAMSSTRRQTRSASSALNKFKYPNGTSSSVAPTLVASTKVSESIDDDSSSLSSADTVDIEDLLEPPVTKRRRVAAAATASVTSSKTSRVSRIKKEITIKQETSEDSVRTTKERRKPARKIKREDGSIEVQPPSNWEQIYETVKQMRADNPTAPVDTMGCAELHWRTSSPRDQRFQTLIALMLSSQTKDTVTAVAMQRLHTELGEGEPLSVSGVKKEEGDIKTEDDEDSMPFRNRKDSTLTLKNILAVSPERLNELIRTVGFHNNKTKYIKQAAIILRDEYDSDIPSTAEELMKLPGVGPKMAYLCMSAAWGKHDGIGVDVHVHRITNLWGWHNTKNPEETRLALQSWLPRDKWHEINKLLVGLGQTVCLPVARRCGQCYLAGSGLCKSEIKGAVTKVKKERTEETIIKT